MYGGSIGWVNQPGKQTTTTEYDDGLSAPFKGVTSDAGAAVNAITPHNTVILYTEYQPLSRDVTNGLTANTLNIKRGEHMARASGWYS